SCRIDDNLSIWPLRGPRSKPGQGRGFPTAMSRPFGLPFRHQVQKMSGSLGPKFAAILTLNAVVASEIGAWVRFPSPAPSPQSGLLQLLDQHFGVASALIVSLTPAGGQIVGGAFRKAA